MFSDHKLTLKEHNKRYYIGYHKCANENCYNPTNLQYCSRECMFNSSLYKNSMKHALNASIEFQEYKKQVYDISLSKRKLCSYCHKLFKPQNENIKYCSRECMFKSPEYKKHCALSINKRTNTGVKHHQRGILFSNKNNREIYYRSSWELKYFKHIEENNEILSYEVETIAIPYILNKEQRYYIPDILIYYKDRKELVEIKPYSLTKYEINKLKFEAAYKYSAKNNMVFRVITEKDFDFLSS